MRPVQAAPLWAALLASEWHPPQAAGLWARGLAQWSAHLLVQSSGRLSGCPMVPAMVSMSVQASYSPLDQWEEEMARLRVNWKAPLLASHLVPGRGRTLVFVKGNRLAGL